ncbi:hypothetical protein TRIUR3_32130 [Triticum urartu]|uniref:Uncharacterized protein n=1 Tax=Triticum urartu TaxID=4572 RepID=M8A6B5_TRIUA|nr:hypothetical protein TRIUR3_32130 [Triticum urartu]
MDGGSGGEEPFDDLDACSVDHNHCVRKKEVQDFDLHTKSARVTTTKETGVRLSTKARRQATIKIMSRQ